MTVRRFAPSSLLLATALLAATSTPDSDHMVRPEEPPPDPPEPRNGPITLEFDAVLAPKAWDVPRPEGDAGIVHDALVLDDRAVALGDNATFIAVRDAITKRARKGARAARRTLDEVLQSHLDRELAPRWERFTRLATGSRTISIGGVADLRDPRLFNHDTFNGMVQKLRADLAKQGIHLTTPDDTMRAKFEAFYANR